MARQNFQIYSSQSDMHLHTVHSVSKYPLVSLYCKAIDVLVEHKNYYFHLFLYSSALLNVCSGPSTSLIYLNMSATH